MKVVLQRVSRASVEVSGNCCGEIATGLLALVGFGKGDDSESIERFLNRVPKLRLFADQQGRFQHSLEDISGSLLIVSQFTLLGSCEKGRRPDFGAAMPPAEAKELYEEMLLKAREYLGESRVSSGEFGAVMEVELINSGPVTMLLDF